MAYATPDEKRYASLHGYKISESVMFGTKFYQNRRHIWSTSEGRWQTADLVDDYYTNHQLFDELKAALRRPL